MISDISVVIGICVGDSSHIGDNRGFVSVTSDISVIIVISDISVIIGICVGDNRHIGDNRGYVLVIIYMYI